MKPTIRPLAFALAAVAAGCSTSKNTDHCSVNDGDDYCARLFPDRPYCTQGEGECALTNMADDIRRYGCVAPEDLDPACHDPCGDRVDENCPGTETESDTVAEGSTGPTSSTDGPSTSMGPDSDSESDSDSDTDTGGCTIDEHCGGDTPFCDAGTCVACGALPDGDEACAGLSGNTPVCFQGACVTCTADKADACSGSTPVCGDNLECRGCEEHFECPMSACHLDGGDRGACFDMAGVVTVANGTELQNELNALGNDAQAVIRLQAGTYNVTASIGGSREVALLGQGNAILAGNGSRALDAFANAHVYVANMQIVNGSGDGAACSGSSLWIDDTQVRNNAQVGMVVSGGCDTYLRRSVIRANNGGGVTTSGAASALFVRTSAISLNGGVASSVGGIEVTDATLDITYSTLVGNQASSSHHSIRCLGSASGSVRNSIVVGSAVTSVVGCDGVAFEHSGVDQGSLGATNQNVGMLNLSWFQTPAMGDFRLTNPGETTFADIAQWQAGDPLADIDGNPIPTDIASFPGYHQP